jgi:type I restriction enzyme, S subunit
MNVNGLSNGREFYELGELLSYEQPTKHIVETTNYNNNYKTPVLTAGKSFILGYTNETKGIYSDLPVIIFDDFTTSSKYVNFPFKVKSSAMKILSCENKLADIKYLYYLMQILECNHDTHKRYWISIYSKIKIQLPTLAEQERIVMKIEELLSELDKGVAELQKIKQQLKIYRQAVLKDAFEGKLTKDWRKAKDITSSSVIAEFKNLQNLNIKYKDDVETEEEFVLSLPKEWLLIRFGDVFDIQVGATPSRKKPEYWNGEINWVSSGEVKFCNIRTTKEKISEMGLDNTSTNVQPIGTVLLAMIGEGKTRGQAAILNVQAAHNQNTAAILVSKTNCEPKYVYYYLLFNYQYTRRIGSGNNQKALNKEKVKSLRFPFTSVAEQKQVSIEIELRLSVYDKIEQIVDESLLKSNRLQQSILKNAFEGKLV